jgi:bla regulator protein BlaR1
MTSIAYNIGQALGITILHSLWQGLVVYMVMRLVLAVLPALSSVKKYNLAVLAGALVCVWFTYTLFAQIAAFNLLKTPLLKPAGLLIIPAMGHVKASFYQQLSAYLPYITAIYFIGVTAKALKLTWEWHKVRVIKKSLLHAEQMQQYINKFSKKLGITKKIHLNFSELINVPCVIGYLKPIILLPVSLSTALTACEVEAILLHELSHIKRNDYLVNLLQQAVSVVLFFNPFIWLINRVLNQERENSCDDLVIQKTGKPLIYANALLKLEQSRHSNLQLALASTGKKFHLLNRIERIMKTQKQGGNVRHTLIGLMLLAGSLAGLAWFNPANAKKTGPKLHPVSPAFILKTDSLTNNNPADTSKGKHVHHTVAKNNVVYKKAPHHTIKKTGHRVADSSWSDSIAGYYLSPEWKAQMAAIRKQGEEINKQFNSPEWKAQMAAIRKQGDEIKKQFDRPEWKAQMLAMQKQNNEMRKQFDSPEWKKQMDDIKKQGDEIKKQFDSPEWKKQIDDIRQQNDEIKKQFDNPEWRKQMEDIKKQGDQIKKQFDNPEWKKQMRDIQKQGKEIQKQFDNPEWKKQMKDIQKMNEKMEKQFDSTGWRRQFKELKKYKVEKWVKKDSVSGVGIYRPADKDTLK